MRQRHAVVSAQNIYCHVVGELDRGCANAKSNAVSVRPLDEESDKLDFSGANSSA